MSHAVETTASRQGYMPASHRPQCGNCHMRVKPEGAAANHDGLSCCKTGGFAVASDGWCTLWLPERRWLEINPDVAYRMGLASGPDL